MDGIPSQHLRQAKMPGHGKVKTIRSGLRQEVRPRGINEFQPIQQTAPIQRNRQFHGETLMISTRMPTTSIQAKSSVPKNEYLRKEDQQLYMQWIEKILDLDRRTSKDPRIYCAYCDMNNHPRFACKHAYKHQKGNEKHRCTLCQAFHAPFCCSRAQINERL